MIMIHSLYWINPDAPGPPYAEVAPSYGGDPQIPMVLRDQGLFGASGKAHSFGITNHSFGTAGPTTSLFPNLSIDIDHKVPDDQVPILGALFLATDWSLLGRSWGVVDMSQRRPSQSRSGTAGPALGTAGVFRVSRGPPAVMRRPPRLQTLRRKAWRGEKETTQKGMPIPGASTSMLKQHEFLGPF